MGGELSETQTGDPDLLTRHQQGDRLAFDELVSTFRASVFSYILRSGVDEETCLDLLQEVFLKVHKAAATYQPVRSLKLWVFTVAANTVRSHYRKQAIRRRMFVSTSSEQGHASDPSSHQLAEAFEAADWLQQAITRLPMLQREVIVLSSTEGLGAGEIAEVLAMPINSVKTNLRRARLALARELARRKLRGQREVAP